MFFYHGTRLFAARQGDFKLYFYKKNPAGYPEKMEKLEIVTLVNLQHDPSERFDLAAHHPDVINKIEALVARHRATVVPVKSNLEKRTRAKSTS